MRALPRFLHALQASFVPLAPAAWRAASKMTLGIVLAVALAELLHTSAPYWAGISAMVVVMPTFSSLVHKAWYRILGTYLGAGVGLAVHFLTLNSRPLLFCMLFFSMLLPLYWQTRSRYPYAFLIGGITSSLVMLGGLLTPEQAWHIAWDRSLEVTLGVLSTLLIYWLFTWGHLANFPLSSRYCVAHKKFLLTYKNICCVEIFCSRLASLRNQGFSRRPRLGSAQHLLPASDATPESEQGSAWPMAISGALGGCLAVWLWLQLKLPGGGEGAVISVWTLAFSGGMASAQYKGLLRVLGCVVGGVVGSALVLCGSLPFGVFLLLLGLACLPCGVIQNGALDARHFGLQAGVALLFVFANNAGNIAPALERLFGIGVGLTALLLTGVGVAWVGSRYTRIKN